MEIKKRLLLFLYPHKDTGLDIDITPVIQEFDLDRESLRKAIINMGNEKLIAPIQNSYVISNRQAGQYIAANQTYCKTRILKDGSKMVEDYYLPKTEAPKEKIVQNIIYARDISAPVQQSALDGDLRDATYSPNNADKTQPSNKSEKSNLWEKIVENKIIISIIGSVLAAITVAYLKANGIIG